VAFVDPGVQPPGQRRLRRGRAGLEVLQGPDRVDQLGLAQPLAVRHRHDGQIGQIGQIGAGLVGRHASF
jgi:hypothetical protein